MKDEKQEQLTDRINNNKDKEKVPSSKNEGFFGLWVETKHTSKQEALLYRGPESFGKHRGKKLKRQGGIEHAETETKETPVIRLKYMVSFNKRNGL